LILNNKKILEFITDVKSKQLSSTTLLSFTQTITEKEFYMLIRHFIKQKVTSFYWNVPSEDYSFFAYDEIFSIPQTNSNVQEDIFNKVSSDIISNRDVTLDLKHPLFVGGVKFPSLKKDELWKDFNSSKWFIPKILLLRQSDKYFLTVNVLGLQTEEHNFLESIENIFSDALEKEYKLLHPDETHTAIHSVAQNSDITRWSDQVNSCLEKILNNKLQKVVLARFTEIVFSEVPNIFSQLQRLEKNFDNCYTFAFKNGDSTFFGASPERLFKISDSFLETDALAGSIKRGHSSEEDSLLEKQLLQSEKDLAEHKSVVDFLLSKLTPLTEKILFDSQPSIKKLSNIQHLHSQFKAKLKEDTTIFSLLENLHPTPAVCGFPSESALKMIDMTEDFERGLYAGALGWFNSHNECAFIVGLRSALLNGNTLRAFAGCGIVNGSDPVSEFKEIELKLKPILSLFANEIIYQS